MSMVLINGYGERTCEQPFLVALWLQKWGESHWPLCQRLLKGCTLIALQEHASKSPRCLNVCGCKVMYLGEAELPLACPTPMKIAPEPHMPPMKIASHTRELSAVIAQPSLWLCMLSTQLLNGCAITGKAELLLPQFWVSPRDSPRLSERLELHLWQLRLVVG